MAVTLDTYDLKQPVGELESSLFPDTTMDIDVALTGWLAQATTKVEADADIATADQNAAAAAWVYYRAYSYVAQWMKAEPERVEVGERTEWLGADRAKFFQDLANKWESTFNGYSAPTVRTAFFGLARAGTRHVVRY